MPKENDHLRVTVGETRKVTEQTRQFNETTRWLWFPQIDRFSTGELLVGFCMVPDETYVEGCFSGYCLSEDGGRLLASMYGMGFEDYEGESLILVESEDRGKSWEYFSTICDAATVQSIVGSAYRVEEFGEPSVVQLANGDLLAVFRTQGYQDMYQCWSHDGGRTWTKPRSADVGSVLPGLLLLSI